MAGNSSLKKRQELRLKACPVPDGVWLWCCCHSGQCGCLPFAGIPAAAMNHLYELRVFNVTRCKFRAWNGTH